MFLWGMSFNIEKIGEWTEITEVKADVDRTVAYAQSTNDPIAAHLDGTLAPPLFAVVPIYAVMGGSIGAVTPAEHAMRGVHGEQDMRFHRPMVPGSVLRAKGRAIGVHAKGSGTAVSVLASVEDGDGNLLNEQYITAFIRGVSEGDAVGEACPALPVVDAAELGTPTAEVVQHYDDDQTFRYSEASGDMVPIHLDEDLAKAMGFPGIIGHGLCTMAMNSWSAIETCCDGDPSRLTRLAVRFAKPVIPGDDITTRFWLRGETDGIRTYSFETLNSAGEKIIANGVVEARI